MYMRLVPWVVSLKVIPQDISKGSHLRSQGTLLRVIRLFLISIPWAIWQCFVFRDPRFAHFHPYNPFRLHFTGTPPKEKEKHPRQLLINHLMNPRDDPLRFLSFLSFFPYHRVYKKARIHYLPFRSCLFPLFLVFYMFLISLWHLSLLLESLLYN